MKNPRVYQRDLTEEEVEQLDLINAIKELRPSVIKFAYEMENVLRANDSKGGWDDCPIYYLVSRLVEETGEFFHANYENDYRQAMKEIVDVANFCMMIYEERQKYVSTQQEAT